jgi:hypothetical protein
MPDFCCLFPQIMETTIISSNVTLDYLNLTPQVEDNNK